MGMSNIFQSLVLLTLVVFQAKNSEALLCYQCLDASNDTDCRDPRLLLKDTRDEGDTNELNYNKYVKDCASERTNNTMCIIEIFTGAQFSKVKSYARGCSDGHTFSFDVAKFQRLSDLVPDNQSTCAFDQTGFGLSICVQLCKEDMCNGPTQNFEIVNSTASSIVPLLTVPAMNVVFGHSVFECSFLIYLFFTRLLL